MKVLHISTSDSGGTGKATYRLHKGLKHAGYDSKILVQSKSLQDNDIIEYPKTFYQKATRNLRSLITNTLGLLPNNILFKLLKYIVDTTKSMLGSLPKTDSNYCFYNFSEENTYKSTELLLSLIKFKPDIIILHWISGFINTKNMFELSRATNAPIFWYLLDFAPLTGGCHYPWDCNGYKAFCGNCPALFSDNKNDISSINLDYKLSYIQQTKIVMLYCNNMIKERLNASSLFKDKHSAYLSMGLDINTFCGSNKSIARDKLNLPQDKKIIFVGTTYLNEDRKGINYLIEALHHLKSLLNGNDRIIQNILVVIAGYQLDNNQFSDLPFQTQFIGHLKDEKVLASAYQSADMFICPSIEDAGPLMVLESIACGTPVVAFNIGFANDIILQNNLGYIASLRNSIEMAEGIKKLLLIREEEQIEMSERCVAFAKDNFASDLQIKLLVSIFEDTKKTP